MHTIPRLFLHTSFQVLFLLSHINSRFSSVHIIIFTCRAYTFFNCTELIWFTNKRQLTASMASLSGTGNINYNYRKRWSTFEELNVKWILVLVWVIIVEKKKKQNGFSPINDRPITHTYYVLFFFYFFFEMYNKSCIWRVAVEKFLVICYIRNEFIMDINPLISKRRVYIWKRYWLTMSRDHIE